MVTMIKKVISPVLREKFEFPIYFMENTFRKWYPGHMAKGLRAMRAMIYQCDFVIEVHDARIPHVGRNPNFYDYVGDKSRLLMLNKIDLVDKKKFKTYSKELDGFGRTILASNSTRTHDPSLKKIVPMILKMVEERKLADPDDALVKNPSYKVLVCGVPNTGKSSLINALRGLNLKRGKATPVGKKPGITKSVMNKILIHDDPKIYIFDTPGVIPPQIRDPEEGLKLAIIGSFPDHLIGEDLIADYLLYTLNKNKQNEYVQVYGLPGPCDDFDIVSNFIARTTGFWNGNRPDYHNTSLHFLRQFRKGNLGKIFLGDHKTTKAELPTPENILELDAEVF